MRNALARRGKYVIPAIPLLGVLMALGAYAYSSFRDIPLPGGTWFVLFSCAGIMVMNLYLLRFLEAAAEDSRRQGLDPAHAAVSRQILLAALILAAVAVEARYIFGAEQPYGNILIGCCMSGVFLACGWFLLTDHGDDALWGFYRQVISGNSPFGPNPNRLHIYLSAVWRKMPLRFLMGIASLLVAMLAVFFTFWMEPYAVVERAQRGSAYWQFEAGKLYATGEGLPEDRGMAFALYLAAARQGFHKAYWPVGRMYSRGDGTEQDLAEAVRWFWKAAEEAGNMEAWNLLGLAYGNAEGAEQDPREAARCFARAAEGGDADGQENLGIVYEMGFGLPADLGLALYWYERAAAAGNKTARERAEALKSRGVLPQKPHTGKS